MAYVLKPGAEFRHDDGKKPVVVFVNGFEQPVAFSLREFIHEPGVLYIFAGPADRVPRGARPISPTERESPPGVQEV